MLDVSFSRLVQRSPVLQRAVSSLSTVQFMTNPIDIIANVFTSLKAAEEFVRTNSLESRFGQFVSMFDPAKVASASDQLAFDELFPLFCSVFAASCPVNASAVAAFTGRIGAAGMSAAFDFAKLFLSSAVEHVRSAKVADMSAAKAQQDDDDDVDPLGLTRNLKSSGSVGKLSALYME